MKVSPERGEIWWVNFEPQVGSEIKKLRPAIVINIPEAGQLPLRIVVPLTEYDERRSDLFWFITVEPSPSNKLQKRSQVDCFQVKSVSVLRFEKKIGDLENRYLRKILDALAVCLGI